MKNRIVISFIIPSYNEGLNISGIYNRINKIFNNFEYEIIFVDDGSNDNTFSEIKKIAKNNKKVKAISFSRNFGKDAAIYAGVKESKGEYTCIIDADMQQDPKDVYEMLNIILNNKEIDCVCAVPKKRKENPIVNYIKDSFYIVINKISNIQFLKNASDFKVFNKKVKEAFISCPEKNRFSKGIFSWVGFNVVCYEYDVKPRNGGQTKWTF